MLEQPLTVLEMVERVQDAAGTSLEPLIVNDAVGEIPAETDASRAMSKELRRLGMRFVGPTICYAFMQSAGLVNDHLVDCFRYEGVVGA